MAEPGRLLGDRVEHRLELERRSADELEQLARGRLAIEMFALEIVEPLGAERGADPGPQERRLERPEQVVGRAHLDAPDGAVELVEAADDDDRQVRQSGIGLDRRERLRSRPCPA